MISVSTYVLKTSYVLSNASWEAPTQIESPQIDDTFTVHSFSIIHIRSEPPGVLGDLGRMAIYFHGAGEHW